MAMKSGMLAAEAVFNALTGEAEQAEAASYEAAIKKSWIWKSCVASGISARRSSGECGAALFTRPSTRICCAGGHLDDEAP